jgi:integrase
MKSTAKKRKENPTLTSERAVQAVRVPAIGRAAYKIGPNTPGLELRASGSVKSWSIRYRPKGGGQRRTTYGAYPAISLADARARAKEIAAAAARGVDLPADEERSREEQRKDASRPQTVADLLHHYVERHCKPNQRKWRLTERMFAMHVEPAIGKKALNDLRRADIVELLDELQNAKRLRAQVNRVRSQIVAALNWAVEREYLDANPAAAVKKRKIETSRDRVLSDNELRAIWRAAEKLPDPSRSLVKAWILTGQRRDEVRCMPWAEIDLGRALWTLPAARNKGKRDHEIPLSPAMLTLLGDRPRLGKPVFTTDGQKAYAGQKRLKAILDRDAEVTGWTFHDFRRTASTGMAALHVPQDTIDRVLNHAKGALAGTYNRHQYLDEKRKALEAWAERVAFIVGEGRDAANVFELGHPSPQRDAA